MNDEEKILLVDDDPNVLSGYTRQLRHKFNVETANGGADGLLRLKDATPYAVIVSDYRMPMVDGVTLLCTAREKSPDTVRIMLSGQADMQAAIDAINKGAFFRFLLKPCSTDVLTSHLEAALQQYRLVTAEKTLLEKTLRGSVELLTEILGMANPLAFRRAQRIAELCAEIVKQMEQVSVWEINCSAMLSQIGCITFTPRLQQKIQDHEDLNEKDREEYARHAETTARLLSRIPRLETVAESIRLQNRRYDGQNASDDGLVAANLPVGARILKVAIDYDDLASKNWQPSAILDRLKSFSGAYDPKILLALERAVTHKGQQQQARALREMNIEELQIGMTLAEDLHAISGMLILPKDHVISEVSYMRLVNFCAMGDLHGRVNAYLPAESE